MKTSSSLLCRGLAAVVVLGPRGRPASPGPKAAVCASPGAQELEVCVEHEVPSIPPRRTPSQHTTIPTHTHTHTHRVQHPPPPLGLPPPPPPPPAAAAAAAASREAASMASTAARIGFISLTSAKLRQRVEDHPGRIDDRDQIGCTAFGPPERLALVE